MNSKSRANKLFCILLGILGISGGLIYYLISKLNKFINLGYLSFIRKFSIEIIVVLILLIIACLILLFKNIRIMQTKVLKIKYLLASTFCIIICSYLTLCIFVYVVQDEIIIKNHLIFQPNVSYYSYKSDNVEEITITTPDNISLQGYIVKNSTKDKSPLIIYFGGSGQEISAMIRNAKKIDGWTVALFNYRGFGMSTGTATQDNSFSDAKLIYDTLSKRKDIDNSKIVTMGWSLGTGISVYLSNNRPIKATILVAPIENTYNRLNVPLIPLSIIMKQKFDSGALAPNIKCPLLCLIGDRDINVSPKESMDLVKKWKGTTTVKTYSSDHNLLNNNKDSWIDIQNFLKSFE